MLTKKCNASRPCHSSTLTYTSNMPTTAAQKQCVSTGKSSRCREGGWQGVTFEPFPQPGAAVCEGPGRKRHSQIASCGAPPPSWRAASACCCTSQSTCTNTAVCLVTLAQWIPVTGVCGIMCTNAAFCLVTCAQWIPMTNECGCMCTNYTFLCVLAALVTITIVIKEQPSTSAVADSTELAIRQS